VRRLAGGSRDLAAVATDAGFADQSHFTRATQSELGQTPGDLRRALDGRTSRRRRIPSDAARPEAR
jgi:AraC-like DNA-binding protein